MRRFILLLAGSSIIATAHAMLSPAVAAQAESTDIYIRRLAGLPASSADGAIEIIDVGHLPLSAMVSIVANRTVSGWRVSYACAQSPHCTEGADSLSLDYSLTPDAAHEVDGLLIRLRKGPKPGGMSPDPAHEACGNLTAEIKDGGPRLDFYRSCDFGPELGRLDALLAPPAR
jgi:hypothetical protein